MHSDKSEYDVNMLMFREIFDSLLNSFDELDQKGDNPWQIRRRVKEYATAIVPRQKTAAVNFGTQTAHTEYFVLKIS